MRAIILLKKRSLYCVVILLIFITLFSTYLISNPFSIWTTKGLKQIYVTNTEYKYLISIFEGNNIKNIKNRQFIYSTKSLGKHLPSKNYYSFTFIYKNRKPTIIHYDKRTTLYYDETWNSIKISHVLKEQLINYLLITDSTLENKYGDLIPWEEVKEIFPLMGCAKIVDFKTGISFIVQRRAGSNHADVQPLTADDTAKMKQIYEGKWSWSRRAVIVEVNDFRIAGSINGMPHGSGKISDNNFNGHFCIHFLNSSTHSGSVDSKHLIQLLRAGGKLP